MVSLKFSLTFLVLLTLVDNTFANDERSKTNKVLSGANVERAAKSQENGSSSQGGSAPQQRSLATAGSSVQVGDVTVVKSKSENSPDAVQGSQP